jgi:hypothetical protein
MRIAFKEWAAIVDALATGRQIVILRKGGISEGRAGFQVDHPEFLLFPTAFHQQRDSVIAEAQTRFDCLEPIPADIVRIEYFCRVAAWRRLDSLEDAQRLEGQHVWKPDVIEERFDWGRSKAIFALVVRTFRLQERVDLPMSLRYGGCKSWIELERDIDVSNARPVLSDDDFEGLLKRFNAALSSAPA